MFFLLKGERNIFLNFLQRGRIVRVMNRYEIKHQRLKKQLALLGIFDSDAETKELKMSPVYLNAAGEQEKGQNGNLIPDKEKN